MRPNRYVRSLTDEETAALQQRYRQTNSADVRTRCQMILFSAQGHTVAEIATWLLYDEDTVWYWLDRYETENLAGLEDRPRCGRPPKRGGVLPG